MQLHLPVLALSLTLASSIVQSKEADTNLDIFVQQDDTGQLQQTLKHRGWEVREGKDGELLLFPGKSDEDNHTQPETAPRKDSVPDAVDLNALEAALQPHGWETHRDSEGNLLLYPPQKTSQPDETSETSALLSSIPEEPQGSAKNLDQLDDLLQQRGWKTQRDEDGSLLLFPAIETPTSPGFSATTLEHCQFGTLTLKAETSITLPINHWNEAHELATAWLQQQAGSDLQVGKIRQVNRIYVVSMVEKSSPHTLIKQLVINSTDGRIIALP